MVDVLIERVDFPQRLIRVGDPELGLPGVAALHALLAPRVQAGLFEAHLHGDQGGGIGHTEAEVIERSAGTLRRRLQRQHQRRIVQLELGVIGAALGRLAAKQDAIEGDRSLQVGDVERQMKADRGGQRGVR